MSFAPRFLLLFALVIFLGAAAKTRNSRPMTPPKRLLILPMRTLQVNLMMHKHKTLEHLNRGEVQEATALLAQLNLDNPKNEKVRVLLMSLYLLNGNENAARALITSGWPTGHMWFERLKSRHAQKGLLSDITTYLGQRLQSKPRSGIQSQQ